MYPRKLISVMISAALLVATLPDPRVLAQVIGRAAGSAPVGVAMPALPAMSVGGAASVAAPSLAPSFLRNGLVSPTLPVNGVTPRPRRRASAGAAAQPATPAPDAVPTPSAVPSAASIPAAANPAAAAAAAAQPGAPMGAAGRDAAAAALGLQGGDQAAGTARPGAIGAAQAIGGLGQAAGPKFDGAAPDAAGEAAVSPVGGAPLRAPSGLAAAGSQPSDAKPAEGGMFRPKSVREGIGPVKYVWWNSFHAGIQLVNQGIAKLFGRIIPISWDWWPTWAGLLYQIGKIRYVRSNTLTDPYDYLTNDTMPKTKMPAAAKEGYLPDAKWALDDQNPQMGTPNTRVGSNLPPMSVKPDPENARPSAHEAAKLMLRKIDPVTGREIVNPAGILNVKAGGWIQFQFHNFGGNTKRDPITENPHVLPRPAADGWPNNVGIVDRTSKDPTRVTDDGRPTPINEKVQAWVQGQLYGSNESELNALRSFKGGKMRLDENGNLPEDPKKKGIDQTGFNNNYNPILSYLHWLFVKEHNAIADYYAYFHPDWSEEKLFQMARKVNVAQIARIHTLQWTKDLLQHAVLQKGMDADWNGLLGQKRKTWLMRMSYRFPWLGRLLRPIRDNDMISGMPGSRWEHHEGPFQVPKHFRMVYRLHQLILSDYEILDPKTGRTLDRIDLLKFVHGNTRPIVEKFGYEALAYSFQKKSAGALTLHNFPNALTIPAFKNQQNGQPTNLAELDLLRERTDGTGTFNEFMESVGEPAVKSFLELTGGDVELAKEIETMYEGDIDRVDAGIGILAYPKPAGFALSFPQYYQFILNAPRRVKSNRHMTELFDYENYQEGMDWIEHGGGIFGAERRHVPGIAEHMEGVLRSFMPWPDAEKFPKRLLKESENDAANVFKADVRTFVLAAAASAAALWTGVATPWLVAGTLAALAVVPLALAAKRMLALFYMRNVWEKVYTDKRTRMFESLYKGESWINRAAFLGKVAALGVVIAGAKLALLAWAAGSPLTAGLVAIAALSGISTYTWSTAFAEDAWNLKITLRSRMRKGMEQTDKFALAADVDMAKFEDDFKRYAPGREYMSAYDFDRMREDVYYREGKAGVSLWTRWSNWLAAGRQAQAILAEHADMVVSEELEFVPAISKAELLRVYQKTTMQDPIPLPVGSFKGTTKDTKGRDVMALLIKEDPRNVGTHYAILADYTRLNIPSPERLQITKWVPRMYTYKLERIGGQRYALRTLKVDEKGEIVPDMSVPASELKLPTAGSMEGAVLIRRDKDGEEVEAITINAGAGSTWEDYVPGKYFWSKDSTGGDYLKKTVNTTLTEDRVAEFATDDVHGRFDMVEKAPGLWVFVPKGTGGRGAEKLEGKIGVFIDIVNWKPVFTTDELMIVNPNDANDVGFFYERH
ncbi:MAG: hypothetical protein HYZ75_11390 [Elusimicrobia bacterium]|nr:hypothetical protein [Elusimicrobiota bacterium]